MKKQMAAMVLGTSLALGFAMTSLAGEWKQDDNGYWWQDDNGGYPVSSWQWLDGNKDGIAECYYFDASGYLVTSAVIDGSEVNADGAWIVDGTIQTREAAAPAPEGETGSQAQAAAGTATMPDNGLWSQLHTGFVKKKYVDFLNQDRDLFLAVMGEEVNLVEKEGLGLFVARGDETYSYVFNHRTVLYFDIMDGKVVQVRAFKSFELINADKNEYTYEELNQLFGTAFYYNTSRNPVWNLGGDVYYIIDNTGDVCLLYSPK